jgi:hypothetical protein
MNESMGGCCAPKKTAETQGEACCAVKSSCCFSQCRNVGTIDRVARAVFGLVLISLVFVGPQTPWGWLGVLPLISAAVGWCGMYRVMGINTCCRKDTAAPPPPPSNP